MGEEKPRERSNVSSLLLDIEQDARRGRERLGWRVCNDAQRQQGNAVGRARARNEFCFHVDCGRPRFVR